MVQSVIIIWQCESQETIVILFQVMSSSSWLQNINFKLKFYLPDLYAYHFIIWYNNATIRRWNIILFTKANGWCLGVHVCAIYVRANEWDYTHAPFAFPWKTPHESTFNEREW